jgi:hypothetical protein
VSKPSALRVGDRLRSRRVFNDNAIVWPSRTFLNLPFLSKLEGTVLQSEVTITSRSSDGSGLDVPPAGIAWMRHSSEPSVKVIDRPGVPMTNGVSPVIKRSSIVRMVSPLNRPLLLPYIPCGKEHRLVLRQVWEAVEAAIMELLGGLIAPVALMSRGRQRSVITQVLRQPVASVTMSVKVAGARSDPAVKVMVSVP